MNDLSPSNGEGAEAEVRAVMYARMSTEHQQYSTENQSDVIHEYAQKHGMKIVRTYMDEGKSGLRLDGRDALKSLIEDAQSGDVDFQVILVYDVSRWGRFQDADESAYYEYICRKAGIRVIYCAEQFENDGSPVSTIVKGVKRAMAGEYSRELSSKVFVGQCKLIQLGYRQGGMAGYGLRRMLIDQAGNRKGELSFGEHKSIQTDRVILIPGPDEEVEVVRWMHQQFAEELKTEAEIAVLLNERGVTTDLGCLWTRNTVRQVLTNEKYTGNNVYNRTSFKLKKKRVRNPQEMWVRADGAFEPIVDADVFATVQALILERSLRFSDDELLDKLKSLYHEHGRLSAIIIDESTTEPSSSVYRHRFGGLLRAYRLVGYSPDRDYAYLEINRCLREMFPGVIHQIIQEMRDLGGTIAQDERTGHIIVNNEFSVSLVIARCIQTPAGFPRWMIRLEHAFEPDIAVAARMDISNQHILDYYLLPTMEMKSKKLRLCEDNGLWLDAYRFESLDYLFGMAERTKIEVAA